MSAVVALALFAESPSAGVVTLHGVGDLPVGVGAQELRTRFGAEPGEGYPDPEVDCAYWTSPRHPGLQLMVSGGRLVRIETEDSRYRTASGARVGMGEVEVRSLYRSRMRVEPHPYMGPEGKYLIVRGRSELLGLIIETWDGRARSLRVGLWRRVQLIEGCS